MTDVAPKIAIPRWLKGPEKCIACNSEATLSGYCLDLAMFNCPVLAEYTCTCGYVTRFHFTGARHKTEYGEFIDKQVQAGIIKKKGDGLLA